MPRESQHNHSSKEEVLNWIELYQTTNDEIAQTNLVIHYRQLVESIARKYAHGKSYYDDIVQVGMLGLLGAIRRFDSTYGRSFEAFAVPTIVGEIKRFLRDKTWDVHVPRRIKELGPRIKSTVEKLTSDLQRSPSISEIASYLDERDEQHPPGLNDHLMCEIVRQPVNAHGGNGDAHDGFADKRLRFTPHPALCGAEVAGRGKQ